MSQRTPGRFCIYSRYRSIGLALAAYLVAAAPVAAQMTPDQQADMLLNSARKAYNEKNYPFARDRFKEFLTKFGGHKQLPSVRYGLALSLLECPEKDYNAAAEQLQPLANSKEMAEYPFIL